MSNSLRTLPPTTAAQRYLDAQDELFQEIESLRLGLSEREKNVPWALSGGGVRMKLL